VDHKLFIFFFLNYFVPLIFYFFIFVEVKFDIHLVWVFYLNKNFVAFLYLCVLYIFIIRIQLFFLLFFFFFILSFSTMYSFENKFSPTKKKYFSFYFFQTFRIICILFVLKYKRYYTKRFLLILY
jgi:hypothetical protein